MSEALPEHNLSFEVWLSMLLLIPHPKGLKRSIILFSQGADDSQYLRYETLAISLWLKGDDDFHTDHFSIFIKFIH